MDFEFSARSAQLQQELLAFMDSYVYPAEELYESQLAASGDPHSQPPDAASWITGHTLVVDGGAMVAPSVAGEDQPGKHGAGEP